MEIHPLPISGCFEIRPRVFADSRGRFVKTFHSDVFRERGLATDFREQYYSESARNVLRGMHFQVPPADHEKLVCCLAGSVLDAVLDIRKGSPTYGKHVLLELSSERANMIYVPRGLAHGFLVVSETALVSYNVTTVHSPSHDRGILWNSAGIPWPAKRPILSDRDSRFVPFDDFDSPFVWRETRAA